MPWTVVPGRAVRRRCILCQGLVSRARLLKLVLHTYPRRKTEGLASLKNMPSPVMVPEFLLLANHVQDSRGTLTLTSRAHASADDGDLGQLLEDAGPGPLDVGFPVLETRFSSSVDTTRSEGSQDSRRRFRIDRG